MTKPSIYDQHDKAFAQVSAYVILKNGERVATIAFKFPRDGAGRLYAYAHFIGVPMVRAFAGGYGYDKRSAAVQSAIGKIEQPPLSDNLAALQWAQMDHIAEAERLAAFKAAFDDIGGQDWDTAFRKAGFTVLQAV